MKLGKLYYYSFAVGTITENYKMHLSNITLKVFDSIAQLCENFSKSDVSHWVKIIEDVCDIIPEEDESKLLKLLLFKMDKKFQVYFVNRSFQTILEFCEFVEKNFGSNKDIENIDKLGDLRKKVGNHILYSEKRFIQNI